MNRFLLLPAACALALGCAAATPPVLTMDKDATDKIKAIPDSTRGEIAGDAAMRRMLLLAREDLAGRLKVEAEEIEVLEASYVTWRDTSYGCPRPNAQYMQVLSDGARIKLRVNKRTYHYHSGKNRPLFYCDTIAAVEPLPYHFGDR